MTDTENRDNPYVGLRPFFEEDSFYFFGRNEQVTELLELLHETHFVPVLGSSGSGKSSLVRAGLMPALRAGFMVAQRDGWRMAKCLPGDAPIENFAEGVLKAIGNKPSNAEVQAFAARIREDVDDAVVDVLRPHVTDHDSVLLLIDQFEELFAFRNAAGAESDDDPNSKPDAVRTADRLARRRDSSLLVSMLLALADRKDMPVYIVTTMRTDFLGDCDIFNGLPEAINRSGYLVPRLTRAQLRAAIESPAKLMGVRVAPRLVDRILNDVGDRMDRLPLMQHALHQTYEAWRAAGMMGPLDLRDLEKVGGLDGALNVQAEATIAGVDPLLTERVFKRLTDVDINQRRVRHPTRLSDLRQVVGPENTAALQSLLDRCVVDGTNFMFASADGKPDDPRYNITHESLIRQWDRLRKWVDEEQAQRDWYIAIAERAALYASDTDSGLMPRRDVRVANETIKKRAPTAAWAARYAEAPASFSSSMKFVHDSSQHWKRQKFYYLGAATALLLLVVTSAWAVVSNGKKASEALKRVDDVARYSAIEKLLAEDPTYATALAAELTDTTTWKPERFGLLQRAFNADHATAEFRHMLSFDMDGTGTEIAVGYPGGRVDVGDIDGRGAPLAVFQSGADDTILSVGFVRNRGVIVGYRGGDVRLWKRPQTGSETPITEAERSWRLPVPISRLWRLADSTTLIAVDDSGHMFAWKIDDAKPRPILAAQRIIDVYVHPANARRTVVVTEPAPQSKSSDYDLRILDATTGNASPPLQGISRTVPFVSFKATTDEMLIGQVRGPVLYFKGDKRVGTLGDSANYVSADFNPRFATIVASTRFGVIDQYFESDLLNGRGKATKPQLRYQGHDEYTQAAYSRDGQWVLSWAADGSIRWSLDLDSTVTSKFIGHRASVDMAVTSPNDSRIASWDADGTLRIWRTPKITNAIRYSSKRSGPWRADLSASGSNILIGYYENSFDLQSLADSTKVETLDEPLSDASAGPVISQSGKRVFFEAGKPLVGHIFSSGQKVSVKLAPRRKPMRLAQFSDDDSLLVIVGGSVSFLDGTTGASVRRDLATEVGGEPSLIAIAPKTHAVALSFNDSIMLVERDSVRKLPHDSLSGGDIIDLQFTRDGSRLLVVDEFGAVELVNVEPAKQNTSNSTPHFIVGDGRYGSSAAVSADGSLIAFATGDRAITIYATQDANGDFRRDEIKGLAAYTMNLAFGANNRTLVATGDNGEIRIWSLASDGRLDKDRMPLVLQHTPKVPHQRESPYSYSALSADGKQLASVVAVDGGPPRIGVWHLEFNQFRNRLEQTTTACLDIETRRQLLPNETDKERRDRTDACERRAGRLR